MTWDIRPVPDTPNVDAPDAVATPEGDNEILPDQPLQPSTDVALEDVEVPRGSNPSDEYKKDHD